MQKKKVVAVVLFLEEVQPELGVFHMRDYIVNGYDDFVKGLDDFITKYTKKVAKKMGLKTGA